MQDRVLHSFDNPSRKSSATPGSSRTTLRGLTKNPRCKSLLGNTLQTVVWCCLAISTAAAHAADQNILLDFSATWCGPCQQMSPIVSKLERQGFPIRKVDIDVEKGLAQQFNVESIPCFVLVVNGREVNRITGATDECELRRLLSMLPKQNIDESVFGKQAHGNGQQIPVTPAGMKSSDDKKSFLKLPPLAKNPEVKLTPTDPSEFVRLQSPSQDFNADGFTRDPLSASIRIKVKDASRLHYGSGSIIDSQPGRSLILTCGHIFRDLGKDAVIEVDVFLNGHSKPQTIVGQIVRFDLKSDIGLLAIPSQQQLPTVKLGTSRTGLGVKDRVMSVGCGGGERPSREDHFVTSINKYNGPDNVECNGVPQQGRSGGGLFLGSELVGVCIAADPKEKRGIYTGMKPVAELLAKANLGHLAPSLQSTEDAYASGDAPTTGASLGAAASLNDDASARNDADVAGLIEAATRSSGTSAAAAADYAGAEIVCIVRPKTPGAMSRVVIVNQASSRFVDDLLHESNGGGRPDNTATVQINPAKRPAVNSAKVGTRVAMDKAIVAVATPKDSDSPIETSFEPQRYRRKRD